MQALDLPNYWEEEADDEIMRELRLIREQLSATFNHDPQAIFEHLRAVQAAAGRPSITLPPDRIPPPTLRPTLE